LKDSGKPTYWYFDGLKRVHRSRYTKKLCVRKALLENQELSEQELNHMTENQITSEILGLSKIWDCGQSVWCWQTK
jgi:hypothetical protein